jgi:hypothetical protein
MSRTVRAGNQERFIELNKQFMIEVERGATWSELRWLIEEMKDLAKDFEHMKPEKITAPAKTEDNSPTGRLR